MLSVEQLMLSLILLMRTAMSKPVSGWFVYLFTFTLCLCHIILCEIFAQLFFFLIRMEGGIPPLVELLELADTKVQRAAAGALRTLAFKNDENKNQVNDNT